MYAPLTAALSRSASGTKDLDRSLSGSNRLEAGKAYDVTIVGVDMRDLEAKGTIDVQVEDRETKASHTARLWTVDDQTGKLNRMFSYFLNAVLNTPEAVDMFSEAYGSIGDNAFNLFRGTTLKINMVDGNGAKIHVNEQGTYSVIDSATNQLVISDVFQTVEEAAKELKARQIKRSYPRVARYEVTSEEVANGNKEAFILALNGIRESIERADAAKT